MSIQRFPPSSSPSATLADLTAASYPIGTQVIVSDIGKYGGTPFIVTSEGLRPVSTGLLNILNSELVGEITFGGNGAVYSKTDTTLTVTLAGHGLLSWMNGSKIYLTGSTGLFLTELCTDFTYVGANTFTCESAVTETTSGNLGANTSETFLPSASIALPADLVVKPGDLLALLVVTWGKSSASAKTRRYYYNNVAINSGSVTTGATIQTLASTNVAYVTETDYIITAVSTVPLVEGDRTFTYSHQLTLNTDSMYSKVAAVLFSTR